MDKFKTKGKNHATVFTVTMCPGMVSPIGCPGLLFRRSISHESCTV